jgi:hypothetical protein
MKECPKCHQQTLRVKMYVEFCEDDKCNYERARGDRIVLSVRISDDT